jgi:hypothetical protein
MENIEAQVKQRQQRWEKFYDFEQPVRRMYLIRYAPELPPRPWPNPELRQERLEWIWQNYTYHLERMAWLEDDTIPCLDMLTGTELFAEAFGCRVYRPEKDMPFALPLVNSPVEAEKLKIPSLDAPPLRLAFEMADALLKRAGAVATFRMVDLQSPMDVAALIWEKKGFYMAMVEAPEAVRLLAEKVKILQCRFLDEWFRRYGKGCVAHYPDYYLPQGVSMSVDEIGVVSQKMFERFFLPELKDLSERCGGLGMHSCANNRHQWENFKKIPGLKLLNINQPEAALREAYTFFAGHVAQWHYGWDPLDDPLGWLEQMPAEARVVVDVWAETKEAAIGLAERLVEVCRKT